MRMVLDLEIEFGPWSSIPIPILSLRLFSFLSWTLILIRIHGIDMFIEESSRRSTNIVYTAP